MYAQKRKIQNLQKNDRVYIGQNRLRITKIEPFRDPKKGKFVGIRGKLIDENENVLGRGGFILPRGTEVAYFQEFKL